jgi:hypothetical protein
MRLGTKVVTTAGVTVLSFTVMSGAANADTTGGRSLLSGLTGTVTQTTKIVDGVVGTVSKPTAPKRTTTRAATTAANDPGVNVGVKVKTPEQAPVHAEAAASLSANASTGGISVSPAVDVCVTGAASCDQAPPTPGTPPAPSEPPAPSTPPAPPPTTSGNIESPISSAVSTQEGSLPFTGSPIDALAGLGAALVLTGAAAVATSRRRAGRSAS